MASLECATTTTVRNINVLGSYVDVPEIINTISVQDSGYIWQRWEFDKTVGKTRYQLDGKFTDPTNQGLTNFRQGTLILDATVTGHHAHDYPAVIQWETWYFSSLPISAGSIGFYISVVSFTGTVGLWLKNGCMDAYTTGPMVTLGLDTPITAATTEAYRDDVLAFNVEQSAGFPVGYTETRPNGAYAQGVRAASLPVFGWDDQRMAAPLYPAAPATPSYGDGMVITSSDTRIHSRTQGYSFNAMTGSASGTCTLPSHAEFPATFDSVGLAWTSLDGVKWYARVAVWFDGGLNTSYTILVADVPSSFPGSYTSVEVTNQGALALVDYPGAVYYHISLVPFEYDMYGETEIVADVTFIWATKGCLPMGCPLAMPPAGTGCVEVGLEPGQTT